MTSIDKFKIGEMPSPYGRPVAVFFDRSKHVNEDDCYFFDIDGTMTMAGIFDEDSRRKCAKQVNENSAAGTVRMEIFAQHGGHPVPKVSLPRPTESVYKRFALPQEAMNVVENWVDMALDQKDWTNRAEAILTEALPKCLEQTLSWNLPTDIRDPVIALSTSHMLTSSFEHLPDTEIDTIEAAAMFCLTLHEEWRNAGIEWLVPFRKTWFRAWVKKRPVYRNFARRMRSVDPDLPKWLFSLV
jgi:hypothetical protein